MTASPFFRATCRTWGSLAAAALAASLLALLAVQGKQTGLYSAVALNDDLGFYGRLVVLLTGFIILALAHDEPSDDRAGEFFGALLMINAGAMVVATANDLIFLFVGLELVSMPTYLLLYLSRRTITTQESATKYFLPEHLRIRDCCSSAWPTSTGSRASATSRRWRPSRATCRPSRIRSSA